MRFQFDGQNYVLDFPRRDAPVTVKHVHLKPDQPAPTRRETTARLCKLVAPGDGEGEKPVPVEVMRATVRQYFKDRQWSNEHARVVALGRLLPFLMEPLRNPVRAAYYGRPRGKSKKKVADAPSAEAARG